MKTELEADPRNSSQSMGVDDIRNNNERWEDKDIERNFSRYDSVPSNTTLIFHFAHASQHPEDVIFNACKSAGSRTCQFMVRKCFCRNFWLIVSCSDSPFHNNTDVHVSYYLVGAESALKHINEREAELTSIFASFQISQSDYSVHAGFNESLIKLGVGYIQEIHAFLSADITADSPLIIELGKLFSPYPGILFALSSFYQTPVFKEDGSVWDFDELVLSRAEKYDRIHPVSVLNSDLIVAHARGMPNDVVSSPSFRGCTNGGTGGRYNGNEAFSSRLRRVREITAMIVARMIIRAMEIPRTRTPKEKVINHFQMFPLTYWRTSTLAAVKATLQYSFKNCK